jgi:hypothetical protein
MAIFTLHGWVGMRTMERVIGEVMIERLLV